MDRLLWPVSNWLWANIVNPLVAGVMQLTPRRIVYLAAFLAVAYAAAPVMTADLAVMFAGDSALYFEIVSFAYFAIVRARIHRAAAPAMQLLRAAAGRGGRAVVRIAARTKRSIRLPRLFDKEDSGDVPDAAMAFA